MFEASGRVALVTGAGQNVGAGIARALAQQGATVAINDLDPERADAVVHEIDGAGGTAVSAAFDVRDERAVDAAVAQITDAVGPIDILVNNAGIPQEMQPVPFRSMTPADWRPYVDLNLYGSMLCMRAVLGGMSERGWGRIVQISSGAGRTGLAFGVSIYGASKSGIEGFVRHLSQEVAREGITVNALALGLMENAAGAGEVASLARGVPAGRLGSPADVGAAVVYLVSDEASWLTGQTIDLNGGATQH